MRCVQLHTVGSPLEDRRVDLPALEDLNVLVRVTSAGICRSDVHYRAGTSYAGPLPVTPGHEISGVVEDATKGALAVLAGRDASVGTRVAIHYLESCGQCRACIAGREQFCENGRMIGKHRDGGFAEYVIVPARNLLPVPETVSDDAAAVMMCSSATALHALRRSGLSAGDRLAVFGVGGLGMSAVQLAIVAGAREVYAVDRSVERLALAESFGAIPVNAGAGDTVATIREATTGGVERSVELLGLPATIEQSIAVLAPGGTSAIAGIAHENASVPTYEHLVGRETAVVGVSDHTLGEIEYLLHLAAAGRLDLDTIVTRTIPLGAASINGALDDLESFGGGVRTVIRPGG